jgi:hypothetical protein
MYEITEIHFDDIMLIEKLHGNDSCVPVFCIGLLMICANMCHRQVS